MKAVQILMRDQVSIVDVDPPSLEANRVLLKANCISLCGSDVWMLQDAPPEDYPQPIGVSGHEVVSEVVAIGKHTGALDFAVGDHVLVLSPALDAMSELYIAPIQNVLPLPSGVPLPHLLQAQQLGTVIYACQSLPNVIGKTVAVIGQGSAGLWFNLMLKRLGARRVVGLDLHAHRVALSTHFEADLGLHNEGMAEPEAVAAVNHACHNAEVDIVIDAAGTESALNLAIALATREGFILSFGVPHQQQLTLDYYKLFRKCLTVRAVVGATIGDPTHACTRQAIDLIANGIVDLTPLITHHFPFSAVAKAYALQANPQDGAVKIVVNF